MGIFFSKPAKQVELSVNGEVHVSEATCPEKHHMSAKPGDSPDHWGVILSSVLLSPKKNRATVPGPVWEPITAPMLFN